jgi:DNA-binding MarR family transcriptional regulator
MIERTPGITRLLDRLEAKRLVRRQRCPSDRRQVLCWITESGLRLLKELQEPVDRADHEAIGSLAAGNLEQFIELLEAVRQEVK